MLIAANAEGKSVCVRFVTGGDGSVNVDFAAEGQTNQAWFDAIVDRQCTRSEYDGCAISLEHLKLMEEAGPF